MNPPNWDRLQEIYHAALALPRSERNSFVTNACAGDPDLLGKVNSLLKTDDDFLKDPVFVCPSLADSVVGTTIDGRYVVQKALLPPGGMGRVYVARDLQLPGRLVVIKVLTQTSIQDADAMRRAKREIQALTVIDHPNVVSVYGAGELSTGTPYIAMQYIDGVTLRSQIQSNGMDAKRAASILKQIGAALGHIHSRGILHRDLKPENIMIQVLGDGTEDVKILDFGIAKIKDSVLATSTLNTVAIGTVAYMSPEQLRGGERITAASDIYAMAVVACEMITGKRPPIASQGRAIQAVDLPEGLPPNARNVIIRALSLEPTKRYQSAKQFGDDIEKVLLGGKVEDPDPPPSWPSLTKSLTIFAATLILALLSYGIYNYINRQPILIPNNVFKYWVMEQQMVDGKEYGEPEKRHGNDSFNTGDKFQLYVSTTEPGYLYIFHEGTPGSDSEGFKMIHPNRATNNGSASIGANQTVQSDWMIFQGTASSENFWIVWSTSPVNELESASKQAFNHPQQGLAAGDLAKVKKFLKTKQAEVDSKTASYTNTKETRVRGQTDILVVLAQLKHQ